MNRMIKILFLSLLINTNLGCSKKDGDSIDTGKEENELSYEGSDESFINPERGFVNTYSTLGDNNLLDKASLISLRKNKVSTIIRTIYLENFKNSAISPEKLTAITNDFQKIREAGLKAIIRFAYTNNGSGSDAALPIILGHIDQLKPLFEQNEDIIAFVQAGFIGAWGEWHSSSNNLATVENEKTVLLKLLAVLPKSISVQVRTPVAKQDIFNTLQPITEMQVASGEPIARVGHHNDCFLSSADDYRTYTPTKITAEKIYISQEALYVPVGGETCPPLDRYDPNCHRAKTEMKHLKWSYLNLDWYGPTLDVWRSSGCFVEFEKHLGYRLQLQYSVIVPEVAKSGTVDLKLKFLNTGYAPLYHDKKVRLVLKNRATGDISAIPLSIDLRKCKPDLETVFEEKISLQNIPSGIFDLHLAILDRAPTLQSKVEYNVRLANNGVWDADKGWNSLGRTLKIN